MSHNVHIFILGCSFFYSSRTADKGSMILYKRVMYYKCVIIHLITIFSQESFIMQFTNRQNIQLTEKNYQYVFYQNVRGEGGGGLLITFIEFVENCSKDFLLQGDQQNEKASSLFTMNMD